MGRGATGSDFKEHVLIIMVAEINKDNDTVLYLLKERKNTPPLWLWQILSGGSD